VDRGLSGRLILLTLVVIVGCCGLATALSGMIAGELAAYPMFAVAAFCGGALGARLTRRRSVIEGAIAATICGVVTALVNASVDELRLVDDPASRSAGWVIGAGIVCLVAAVLGGRLGERGSDRAPSPLILALAFGAAVAGLGFTGLLGLYAVHELWGDGAMVVVELAMLALLPVAAAALLVSVVEPAISWLTLFFGAFILIGGFGLAAINQVSSVIPLLIGCAVAGALIAALGCLGRPLGSWLRRVAGPLEPESIATATARSR
jgi:hypothetical protein